MSLSKMAPPMTIGVACAADTAGYLYQFPNWRKGSTPCGGDCDHVRGVPWGKIAAISRGE